ncbi:hypothetical protein [Chitinilyticum aquatile]|uniref:hypothetical protein n=1 Tax=Chitinilyticum aquatile TaxID=362520 RepID=UPI000426AAA6|nr:hypothetical protein [Chitinilyticum aquatile]
MPSFRFPGPWQTLLLLLLLLGTPVAAFFINAQFDEPLDSATQQWLGWQLPAVATKDNGYLDLVALDANVPERLAVAAAVQARFAEIASQPGGNHAKQYEAALKTLNLKPRTLPLPEGLCGNKAPSCLPELRQHAAMLASLREREKDALQRYQDMLLSPAYAELLPADVTAPIPRYTSALQLNVLHSSQISDAAEAGNFAGALALWYAERQFWLRAAHGSRTLINLMVTTAMLQRSNRLLGELLAAHPQLKRADLTATRQSLENSRQLQHLLGQVTLGEFQWFAYAIRHPDLDTLPDAERKKLDVALMSTLKPHATLNLGRQEYQQHLRTLGIPLPAGIAAGDLPEKPVCADGGSILHFDNPAGKMLACMAPPDFSSYRDRLATIEKDSQTLLNRLQAQ